MEQLTVFADYRLPQLFRSLGILQLGPALRARIDSLAAIPKDSAAEIALRAAVVVVGEGLLQRLRETGSKHADKTNLTAAALDYHLASACITFCFT